MMAVLWTLVVLLLVLISLGLAVMVLRQRDQTRREAIEALAARRGWSLMITRQSLGRPSILRLSSRSAPVWQAEIKRFEARSGSKAQNITEYHSTATAWPDRLMIVCHALGGDEAHHLATATDIDAIQALVGRDIGETIPPLHFWPVNPEMIVYASEDPSMRTDLAGLAKVFLDWEPLASGPRGRPVMVLGSSGLKVRLRHAVNSADGLERFVDFSTALYRHLSRP